jgi:putative NIF3 family GTP cyclohydrolase 1 type 2
MAALSELIAFLAARLALPADAEPDVPLVWRPAQREGPLRRVGLALEFSSVVEKAAAECDGLFLHRPFRFPVSALPGIPVLASHSGFDIHLTTGFNPALASALGLREIHPLFRPDRPGDAVPIGMIGTLAAPIPMRDLLHQITAEFGGYDEAAVVPDAAPSLRVAVMNALNPALIALAAEQGATVYLTGQMRENARTAARSSATSVIAAGHDRIEYWGLRRLGHEIRQALPAVETVVLRG